MGLITQEGEESGKSPLEYMLNDYLAATEDEQRSLLSSGTLFAMSALGISGAAGIEERRQEFATVLYAFLSGFTVGVSYQEALDKAASVEEQEQAS